jgi:hypothetical protein
VTVAERHVPFAPECTENHLAPTSVLRSQNSPSVGFGPMITYKAYSIDPFEREIDRWRARIRRLDGRNIQVHVPRMEHASITTSADTLTAKTSIDLAKKAIDGAGMI